MRLGRGDKDFLFCHVGVKSKEMVGEGGIGERRRRVEYRTIPTIAFVMTTSLVCQKRLNIRWKTLNVHDCEKTRESPGLKPNRTKRKRGKGSQRVSCCGQYTVVDTLLTVFLLSCSSKGLEHRRLNPVHEN